MQILLNSLYIFEIFFFMSNTNDLFKPIKIIHIALCAGVMMIIFIIKYLSDNNQESILENQYLKYVGVGFGALAVVLSRLIFVNKTQNISMLQDIHMKFNQYKIAMIIQMAILEAAAIINIVIYYLIKEDINFAFSLALLFLMIIRRPSLDKIID